MSVAITADAGPIATTVNPLTATELVIQGAPTTTHGLSDVAILYEELLQLAVNEGNFARRYEVKRGQTFTVRCAE